MSRTHPPTRYARCPAPASVCTTAAAASSPLLNATLTPLVWMMVNDVTHTGSGLILGIESSCDETAAAVVERGRRQLSNVVASQIAIHSPYGGVVPELASREHLRAIVPVVDAALREAGITMPDVDAIAVTEGPGLAGALLVGIGYAKALAWALGKPLIAINHLEGHIHAVLLEHAASLPTAG